MAAPLPELPPLTVRESPPFGPHKGHAAVAGASATRTAVQYNWAHAHMKYLPNEARREAEGAILAAQAEAASQRQAAEDASSQRDSAENRARETEADAARKVREAEWSFFTMVTEFEEKIKTLENLLDTERTAYNDERQRLEALLKESQDAANLQIEQALKRCSKAVSSAEARASDARSTADSTIRRADEEVAKARSAAQARVDEMRRETDARIQDAERKTRADMERMRHEVNDQRRSMEEALRLNAKQKDDALREAERRITERESNLQEWQSLKELNLAKREANLDEWELARQKQTLAVQAHDKRLLKLEQTQHKRTMERTLDRVTRHLQHGDGNTGGRTTPTREVFASATSSQRDH